MNLETIQEKVDNQVMQYGGYWQPLSIVNRIIEEIGELARAINIKYGEKKSKGADDGNGVGDELADILYAMVSITNIYNIKIKIEEEKINREKEDPLGLLSELLSKTSDIFNSIKRNNKDMKKLMTETIYEIIHIGEVLDVDLVRVFNKKIGADVEKLDKFYKEEV